MYVYEWQYLIAKERVLIAKLCFRIGSARQRRACEACPRVNKRASTLRIRKKSLYPTCHDRRAAKAVYIKSIAFKCILNSKLRFKEGHNDIFKHLKST